MPLYSTPELALSSLGLSTWSGGEPSTRTVLKTPNRRGLKRMRPPGMDVVTAKVSGKQSANTLSVIDPKSDAVIGTVNLTSFDEDRGSCLGVTVPLELHSGATTTPRSLARSIADLTSPSAFAS
jgi:hypothetical protein